MSSKAYFPRGNANWRDDHEPIATTQWMGADKIVKWFGAKERGVSPFFFGKMDDEGTCRYLSHDDDSGIVTIAGSRAGKGVSLIAPNLLSYKGPVLVLDLKGENASISATWRKDKLKQSVYVFDPYGQTDFPSASLNLLSFYDPRDPEFIDDITELAEAMIVRGNENDPHWNESARSVIKMVMVYLVISGSDAEKNLVTMRALILNGQSKSQKQGYQPPTFYYDEELSEEENEIIRLDIEEEIWSDQQASFYQFLKNLADHDDQYVSGTAQRLLQAGDRERGSIISSVQRHTEFLDSPCIQRVLKRNEFDLKKLRHSSIYLVLPERRLDGQDRWLRMVITLMLKQLQTDKKKSKSDPSMLVVLDECAILGNMPVLARAASYASGFGVKLWTIWQDLSQLQKNFDKGYETFIGSAGIFTAFGNIDLTTLEYISKRLGKCETPRLEENYSGSASRNQNQAGFDHAQKSLTALIDSGGSTSESDSYNIRPSYVISPLLLPEEIARYFGKSTGKILVLFGQGQPVWAERIKYYEDAPFCERAGVNPFFD